MNAWSDEARAASAAARKSSRDAARTGGKNVHAETAGIEGKLKEDGNDHHTGASNQHTRAAEHHESIAKSVPPGSNAWVMHREAADAHRYAAKVHSWTENCGSSCKCGGKCGNKLRTLLNSNPEGHNQYTSGGSRESRDADSHSEYADRTGERGDHLDAAKAHGKLYKQYSDMSYTLGDAGDDAGFDKYNKIAMHHADRQDHHLDAAGEVQSKRGVLGKLKGLLLGNGNHERHDMARNALADLLTGNLNPKHPQHGRFLSPSGPAVVQGHAETGYSKAHAFAGKETPEEEEMESQQTAADKVALAAQNNCGGKMNTLNALLTANEGFESDEQRNAFFGLLKSGKGGEIGKAAGAKSEAAHSATDALSEAAEKRSGIAKKVNKDRQAGEHQKAYEAHNDAGKAHFAAAKAANDKYLKGMHEVAAKHHFGMAKEHGLKVKSLTGNAKDAKGHGSEKRVGGSLLHQASEIREHGETAALLHSMGIPKGKRGQGGSTTMMREVGVPDSTIHAKLESAGYSHLQEETRHGLREVLYKKGDDVVETLHDTTRPHLGTSVVSYKIPGTNNTKESIMDRERILDALTANCESAEDAAALNALPDTALQVIWNAKAPGSGADLTSGSDTPDRVGEPRGKGRDTNDEDWSDDTQSAAQKKAPKTALSTPAMNDMGEEEEEDEGEGETPAMNRRQVKVMSFDELLNNVDQETRESLLIGRDAARREKRGLVMNLLQHLPNGPERNRLGSKLSKLSKTELEERLLLVPQTRSARREAPAPRFDGKGGGYTENFAGAADVDDVLPILTINDLTESA